MSNFNLGYSWAAGDVVTVAKMRDAIEDATLTAAYIATLQASFTPRGYIDGLPLANNSGAATRDVDIAAGIAKSDDNTAALVLASALTKRTDQPWASGTGNGGMDTGTKPNNGTLHVWLITNGTTVDALFSTSASSPTMPSGYNKKRRIGSVLTDGSGNVRAFVQFGERFLHAASISYTPSFTTSAQLLTLAVPAGVNVTAQLVVNTQYSGTGYGLVSSPSVTDQTPGSTNYNTRDGGGMTELHVVTNTSAQVRYRASATPSSALIILSGWIDRRGSDM